MSKLWKLYNSYLYRYPMRTQMIQTGIVMGMGDVIAQFGIKHTYQDTTSTARFVTLGIFLVGPSVRIWHLTLERIVGGSVTAKSTMIKMILDQILFAPPFTGLFIFSVNAIQRKPFPVIRQEMNDKFRDVVIDGWKIWPATQILNFYFVPFLLRPLLLNFVALFWNTYLAWKTNL